MSNLLNDENEFADYLLYFTTTETTALIKLFDTLKDLVPNVHFICTPEGIKILEIDEYDTLMVHLLLDKLTVYYCAQETFKIKVPLPHLTKFLKTIGSSEKNIVLYVNKETPELLEIVLANGDEYCLKLMEVDEDLNIQFPDEKYDLFLDLETDDFKNICAGTKATQTNQLHIIHQNGDFTFRAEGEIGYKKATRRNEETGKGGRKSRQTKTYRGLFDFDRLSSFSKFTGVTDKIRFRFEKDCPVMCECELPIGDLTLILSPMCEEDGA